VDKFYQFLNTNKQLILVVLILLFAITLTRATRWLMNKSFLSASKKIKVDATRYRFIKNAATFIIWFFAIAAVTYMIPKLKALAITLFAGAGVFLAIVGFAAQQAFSNIISGIFIVIFKPFRVGDLIQVGAAHKGTVEDITLRHTVITNFENKRIIIPNSVISSETLINSNIVEDKVCELILFEISFEADLERAMAIMREESRKHPHFMDNRTAKEIEEGRPEVLVFVIGFGDSSVKVRASVWCNEPLLAYEMHFDLNKSIKQKFDEENIEIPYPHRTIVQKKEPSN
jgi:small conductance mechanosensitive channel